jgi:protein TonB
MARRKKQRSTVYIVSVAAHLAVGAVLALVPQDRLREVVAIALNEAKEDKKPEPPKPPPHAAERPSRAPGNNVRPAAAAPVAAAAAAADAPVFTDIGIALDSSSSDGIAVNMAPPVLAAPVAAVEPPKPKVLVAHRAEAACNEEIVKARPLGMVRPSYTESARRARVQGRVRITLDVNEQGEVIAARILQGLGYGLDEAALDAARRLRFSPAQRCSRPVAAPFVIAMRFVLPT